MNPGSMNAADMGTNALAMTVAAARVDVQVQCMTLYAFDRFHCGYMSLSMSHHPARTTYLDELWIHVILFF